MKFFAHRIMESVGYVMTREEDVLVTKILNEVDLSDNPKNMAVKIKGWIGYATREETEKGRNLLETFSIPEEVWEKSSMIVENLLKSNFRNEFEREGADQLSQEIIKDYTIEDLGPTFSIISVVKEVLGDDEAVKVVGRLSELDKAWSTDIEKRKVLYNPEDVSIETTGEVSDQAKVCVEQLVKVFFRQPRKIQRVRLFPGEGWVTNKSTGEISIGFPVGWSNSSDFVIDQVQRIVHEFVHGNRPDNINWYADWAELLSSVETSEFMNNFFFEVNGDGTNLMIREGRVLKALGEFMAISTTNFLFSWENATLADNWPENSRNQPSKLVSLVKRQLNYVVNNDWKREISKCDLILLKRGLGKVVLFTDLYDEYSELRKILGEKYVKDVSELMVTSLSDTAKMYREGKELTFDKLNEVNRLIERQIDKMGLDEVLAERELGKEVVDSLVFRLWRWMYPNDSISEAFLELIRVLDTPDFEEVVKEMARLAEKSG